MKPNKKTLKKSPLKIDAFVVKQDSVLDKLVFFIKGLLMGFCDVVPGVSGGTIAFITGIYERFIQGVKAATAFPRAFCIFIWAVCFSSKSKEKNNNKKQKKKALAYAHLKLAWAQMDFIFLLLVALGIVTALLLGSRIITWALDNFFIPTMVFFIGLILASAHHLYNKIESHSKTSWFIGIIFFLIGLSFVFLQPQLVILNAWWYLIIVGFVAGSAMILPGVSGSFMMLVFGVYELFLLALHNPFQHITTILLVLLGVIFGFTLVSRVIAKQLEKRHSQTLFALTGLVLGAIAVPIRDVANQPVVWTNMTWIISLSFFLLGFGLVLLLDYVKHHKN